MKKLLLSCFLFSIAAIAFAQAPDISYPNPQVYVVNKAIINRVPVNSGGAVPNTPYSLVTTLAGNGTAGFVDGTGLAARFKTPYAIANDAAGNVYVVDQDNNAIRKVTPAGVVSTFISSGLSKPGGIAVGPDGNIYIADTGNQLIKKATPAGVVTVYAGSGNFGFANGPAATATFKNPQDVAVDAAGNVYVADVNNNQIRKISTGGIVSVFAGSGSSGSLDGPFATARFRNPFGVAVDAAGNVYVADFNNSLIRKVTQGGIVSTLAGNGVAGFADGNGTAARFNKPGDVAVDVNGNVYVTDSYNSLVRKITPAGEVTTFAGKNGHFGRADGIGTDAILGFPIGITIDANGTLYTADNGTNTIRKFATQGYYIDKPLPAGLTFDPTTGTISGTPTAESPATDYVVSAYNFSGGSSFTINITVRVASIDATLSSLTTSTGTLSPVFAPATKSYIVNVPTSTTSITVTPTLNDPLASLTINGIAHVSGTASAAVPLNVGNNSINIKVTSESDTTSLSYLVSVVRAKPPVAPPVIAYPAAKSYSVNLPIPDLGPTVSGGSVPAKIYGEVTTFATGFDDPIGITTDAAGNVYVADASNQIRKITPAGAVSLFVGTAAELKKVTGMFTDVQGNIYAADAGDNKIKVINSAGVVSVVSGQSGDYDYVNGTDTTARFRNPAAVSADAYGNLYIADQDNHVVRKRTLAEQVTTLAGSGAPGLLNATGTAARFNMPGGVTSDADGNVYVADQANNLIRKITPAGVVTTLAGSGAAGSVNGTGTAASFSTPAAVFMDGTGVIYVADAANSRIRKVTTDGEVSTLAGNGIYALTNAVGRLSSFNYPLGVTADEDGHVYVADWGNDVVRKIETTGYSINPLSLPAGLVFDSKTGIISGTPTAVSTKRTFTITAYNLGGSSTSTVAITVTPLSAEARLSALTLSHGILSPVFASSKISYTAAVGASDVSVTPTALDGQATIKVNGITVLSGSATAPIPLALGSNMISIEVTAPDGVTTKTYTVDVTRSVAAPNNNLTGLTLSSGTLNPAFSAATVNYTANVSNATTNLKVTPTSPNGSAIIEVNGVVVASGTQTANIPLNVGLNTITTIVTDENGNDKTYTIQVTRAPSANANLSGIGLSDGTLSPVFASGTIDYNTTVANAVSTITVTPTAAAAGSTITVNGTIVTTATASAPIPLAAGANTITTVVTAQNGTTVKTYTLTVTRAASTSNNLSGLTLSQGVLSPAFASGTLVYSSSVGAAISSVQLTPTATDLNATIKVNSVTVASGMASGAIPLASGLNTITTTVTAQDGVSTKIYTVDITRASSSNANLSALVFSAGTLSPAFDPATITYTSTVGNSVTDITVTPTTADAAASIEVNGVAVSSGATSASIPLNMGANVITTTVTAADKSVKTYTNTVTRASSSNADLSALTLSAGTLSPAFNAANGDYNVLVTGGLNSITVTPVISDVNASITVNGTVVASGAASQPIPLVKGDNPINIVVTAQDGTTTKNYLVTVNKAASGDALLANLTSSSGTLNPAFSSATDTYSVAVSNATTTIKLTPTVSDANASVKVDNVTTASGVASQDISLAVGLNTVIVLVTADNGTIKNYTVNVNRAASADATLSKLTINSATIAPAFTSAITNYITNVGNAVNSVTVTPTVNDANATVTVNGTPVASGSSSGAIPLAVGANSITINVIAQDRSTTKTYTVEVNRAESSNADLSALTISTGTLSPNFTSATTGYTAQVGNATTSITITPTNSDAGAVVRVNGNLVGSGSASAPVALAVGANLITIQVTAADDTPKTYTVTVTRADAIASTDANLTALAVSAGTLTPAFAQATPNYGVSVPNAISTITVTPTSSEPNATITVNSTTVASGTASAAINLNAGTNVITTTVTAEDGTTINSYFITVTRAPSTNADLANIALSAGTLNQVFAAGTIKYTADVSNAVNAIRLTPTTAVTSATVKVNGVTVASGTASAAIPLNVGPNAITTIVTAESITDTKTYTVTVTRAASPNADLANLTLSVGSLSPVFAAGTIIYTANVGNAVNTIRLTPTVDDVNATVKINGVNVVSGTASAALPLVVGPNVITTVVTAPDGTPKTYTVTVTRAQSPNANLANLTLSTGTLNPVFTAGAVSYNATVSNATTTIKVTPTVADAMATVEVNDVAVVSGVASTDITLAVGPNIIKTVVTAEDGTIKTYIVTVERARSPNADLADLSLSTGTLNTVFAPTTIAYTASVSNAAAGITVTATISEPNATLQINGAAVASGATSANIPLIVGPNTIIIKVTAQNTDVKTYTITVTRAPSPDATLSNIVLSGGTLSPDFAPATTGYKASVANEVTSVTLTPTVNEPNATVKVNNITVASGAASGPFALAVGPNVITTTVTAQDGVSTQTYITTVTRAPSSNAFLTALGISTGNYTPDFGTNRFDYSMLVTNKVTSISVTPVLADNTATIKVNDVIVASGSPSAPVILGVGNNPIKVVVTAQDGTTTRTYTVIVNRAQSSENDLSDLTISAGTLTPAFQSGINDYKALVSNATTSLTVKPTVADATATVKVNNVAVASGTSSAAINLAVGINTITATVTAQNSVTNIYKIEVTREASDNADLSNLTANTGAFSQAFASNTVSYTAANVNNAISTIKLTPTASDATATITVNGITVTSGIASPDIPLNVGINVILVTVKAQKGNIKTYEVTIYRDPSSNADLAGITVSGGSLSPAFAPGTTGYNTGIDNANTGITVTPNTSDATATVTVNDVAVTPGTASGNIPLLVGPNTITIVVTAQDGKTKKYMIVATRERSANADLTNLAPNAGTLLPAFESATENYDLSVVNTVTSIRFTPTVSDATATVKINGTAVTSGTASASIPLALGPNNMVTVVVTAQNNVITKEYRVNVTRQPSSNADLSNLTSNAGALTPAFAPGEVAYRVNVSNTTTSATVTPTASDVNATIAVRGQALSSGTESAQIQLVPGDNDILIVVTAQDGAVKTYTVTVNRAFSNDANLGNLELSPGTLSSPFASGTTDYESTVPFATNRIKVTPTLSDGTASVTVNGTAVTSGASSGFVNLAVGPNPITIVVTAADGTPKTYTVIVTREALPPSANASLSSLFLTQGELSPSFNRTTYLYTATVQSSITKTNVVPTVSEPGATITVNGVKVNSGASSGDILLSDGPNQIFVVVTAEDGIAMERYTIVVTRANFAAKLPNVFTPNGDGYNDTWNLANINLYPDCTVKIFNRGGLQVFNSVGYGIAWDGTYNGKPLPNDTYYYIVDLKHGQGVRSGSVTIIK